jgi:hypothetical protein
MLEWLADHTVVAPEVADVAAGPRGDCRVSAQDRFDALQLAEFLLIMRCVV